MLLYSLLYSVNVGNDDIFLVIYSDVCILSVNQRKPGKIEMKKTANQSINASLKITAQAQRVGINAFILESSKPRTRRYSANGSTASPQKVVEFNGIRMSLGQAKQYVAARA